DRAAATRALDLTDVLELVNDRLDERALAQKQLVRGTQEVMAHVLAQLGDQSEALLEGEALGEGLRNVALVGKELPKEPMDKAGNRFAVVEIARDEAEGQPLATVIHHQMQFEAVEPAHRGLAAVGIDTKDAMCLDALGATDGQRGEVDEADARTFAAL